MPKTNRARVLPKKRNFEDRLIRMILEMTQKRNYQGGSLHIAWAEALSEDIIRLFKEYGYERSSSNAEKR